MAFSAMARIRILPDQVANQIAAGVGAPLCERKPEAPREQEQAPGEPVLAGRQMTTRAPIHD